MPQNPTDDMFSGPYRDPAENVAHKMVTGAGETGESKPDKELDEKVNKFNEKTDEFVVNALKGKPPTPPRPKAPKPPKEAYMKTSDYAVARAARK